MIFKNLNNKFKKGFGYYVVYLFLWLTFSIGVLRFLDDIKNLSGAINYWNIFLFLAIISYQDCLRCGSKKYYKFLGTIGIKTPSSECFSYFLGLVLFWAGLPIHEEFYFLLETKISFIDFDSLIVSFIHIFSVMIFLPLSLVPFYPPDKKGQLS